MSPGATDYPLPPSPTDTAAEASRNSLASSYYSVAYASTVINLNPGTIPGCSKVITATRSYAGGAFTTTKTNPCFSDIFPGWTPSSTNGPQPTPSGGTGPDGLTPHSQSSMKGGLWGVGGPGAGGAPTMGPAAPIGERPALPQPQPIFTSSSQVSILMVPFNPQHDGPTASPPVASPTPASMLSQPSPAPFSVPRPTPVITIGSSTLVQDSSSNFVIGSQTLAPGSSITHSGTLLSLASAGTAIVFGPSTQPIQPAHSPRPAPVITIVGSTLTANSASQFQVGSQTLIPGAPPITLNGQVISLAPSASAIVVGSNTQQLVAPAPGTLWTSPPVITVGGSTITGNLASQFQIGSQTLSPGGAAITHDGLEVRLAPSGNAIIFGPSTQALSTPPVVIATSPPKLTIGNSVVTADASSNYIIAGQILQPGQAITVSGTAISLSPSATAVIINGHTDSLSAYPVVATQIPPLITLDSSILTANSASDYILPGGQTLIPGASALIISGSAYSLAPSATVLVIGTSTEPLSPQYMGMSTGLPILTVGSAHITADSASEYIVDGKTLIPGGAAITISGIAYSLAPSATALVIGTSTEALSPQYMGISTGLPVLTVGSAHISADSASEYIVDGQTLVPGGAAITVSGSVVSLAPSDAFLKVGTSTETLHPVTATTGTISAFETLTTESSFTGGLPSAPASIPGNVTPTGVAKAADRPSRGSGRLGVRGLGMAGVWSLMVGAIMLR